MSTADSITQSIEDCLSGKDDNELARDFILIALLKARSIKEEITVDEDEDGKHISGPGGVILESYALTLAVILRGLYSNPDSGKGSPCLG